MSLLAEVGHSDGAVLVEREARVVGDLPDVALRIGEVRRVTPIERLAGWSCHRRPRALCGRGDLSDLVRRADVVGENDTAEPKGFGVRDTGVEGQLVPG